MKKYIVGVLALALLPGVVAAQQDPQARIEAAKDRVEKAGIPTSLLESRVTEGRAKGVPMDRIAAAVERRAAALARAQQAMRGARGVSEADLAAGADAVEAGLGQESIQKVAEVARAEDRPVALAVLTYLAKDRPVERAVAEVTRALQQGPEALRQLPAQARGGRPEGVGGRPDQVGRGRAGGPPSGVPTPGQRPGSGKPAGVGKPGGGLPGTGKPGGMPGGG